MKKLPEDLAARLLAMGEDVLSAEATPRFEDIARSLGVSRASLYYYFSGQDDLTAFLLRHHTEEGASTVAAAVDDTAPAVLRLRQMLTAMVRYLGEHPGTCSGLLRTAGDPQVMTSVMQVNEELIAAPMRRVLAEGQDEGGLVVDDVYAAADAVIGAVLMAVLGASARGDDPTEDQFADVLVLQLVDGLVA